MSTFVQLKGRVGDLTHRPKNQDDSELGALVNEAYAHVVAELGILEKSVTKTLSAGVGSYSFVTAFSLSDFAGLRSLSYSAANGLNTGQTLSPTSVDAIMELRAQNPQAMSPALVYAIRGWETLELQPLPSALDTLTIVYTAFPAALTNPGDLPSALPVNWHHLIVSYAGAVAMEVVSVARAQQLMEAFENGELKRARRWFNNQQGSRPFVPTGYTRRPIYPGDAW